MFCLWCEQFASVNTSTGNPLQMCCGAGATSFPFLVQEPQQKGKNSKMLHDVGHRTGAEAE
jgi:hypothetical protein